MIELITALASLSLLLSSMTVHATEPDPMSTWIDDLFFCESQDNPNNKHLDVDGYYVYGAGQFKKYTFINNARKFNFYGDVSDEEIFSHIYDRQAQKVLVRNIIQSNYNDYNLWHNCTVGNAKNKVGKPPIPHN